MRRLLSIIISLITVMAFAQQPVESTSNESDPMLRIGKSYLGTRYVANTLDRNEVEQLVINTKEVDCLTFVEYTLAQALGSSFADNLQRIRYRDGIINGYPSRLHYTSDWIDNGLRNGFLTDVTARNSSHTTKLSLSYMSTHPKQYKKLADSPENVTQMAEYEKALSGKTVSWLPKSELPENGLPWIMNGDIIAITTKLPGLDIAHVGIAYYVNGKLHLLHASSTLGKVVVSEKPFNLLYFCNLFFQCRKCGKFFCRSKHYTASVSNICCVKIITPCNINRQRILMIPCFIFCRNPEYACKHISHSPF